MVSQIGSLFSVSAGSSSQNLTQDTKRKLEALGIDTTSIKTEAQGQAILASVEANKGTHQAAAAGNVPKSAMNSGLADQMHDLQNRVKVLAQKVGISISSDEKMEDTLAKIAAALAQIRVQAAQDPQKISIVDQLQTELDSISSSYSSLKGQMQSAEKKLTGSLDVMAHYNKIGLGLK